MLDWYLASAGLVILRSLRPAVANPSGRQPLGEGRFGVVQLAVFENALVRHLVAVKAVKVRCQAMSTPADELVTHRARGSASAPHLPICSSRVYSYSMLMLSLGCGTLRCTVHGWRSCHPRLGCAAAHSNCPISVLVSAEGYRAPTIIAHAMAAARCHCGGCREQGRAPRGGAGSQPRSACDGTGAHLALIPATVCECDSTLLTVGD